MRQELIYLWINDYGCLKKAGFNFSPRYRVAFDEERGELTLRTITETNIYQTENIMNLSAIIGENGSGKTTLLQFLNALSGTPLENAREEQYVRHIEEQNAHEEFLAVYVIGGEKKIVNKTKRAITFEGNRCPPLSAEDFREHNLLDNTTHIYFTNSEYAIDSNLYHRGIDHISIFNSALNSVAQNFYKYTVRYGEQSPTQEQLNFDDFQHLLISPKTVTDFQQILDILFLYRIRQQGAESEYLGKSVSSVRVTFAPLLGLLQRYLIQPSKNELRQFIRGKIDGSSLYATMLEQECLTDRLTYNLALELCILYGFDCESKNAEELLKACSRFIKHIENNVAREYYDTAVKEIREFNRITKRMVPSHNSLPRRDLAYKEWYTISIGKLGALFDRWRKRHCVSFLAKYIFIEGLTLSSGERAMLNFSSRIEMLGYLFELEGREMYKPRENILFLFDEIDLYVHPNAQKKLISALITQVERLFQGRFVQIVISSHSPIVLSDIPNANTLYLMQGANNTTVIREGDRGPQTFAANIPSLYRSSFFIEGGIGIGDYALKLINEIATELQEERELSQEQYEHYRGIISLIGEPILKKRLEEMLQQSTSRPQRHSETDLNIASETDKYLQFLRKQRVLIENEIHRLERENHD